MSKPKILLLDIETFPNVAYVWGKYDQNVIRYLKEGCIATFACKWLHEKEVWAWALPDYGDYKPRVYNDRQITKELWKVLDAADVVIAHNGDDFDTRVINAAFLRHGMKPPSPYKTIDTKKAVKRVARFNSNSLNDLGISLRLGEKIKTDFDLWEGCINGDEQAWADMVTYNKKDILLLEKLYLKIRPWIVDHPNFTVDTGAICPKCESNNVQYRGFYIARTRKYRRFQCQDCGGWGRLVKSEGSTKVTN